MTPRAWANALLLAGIFWASLIVALWLILAPKVGGVEAWHDSALPASAFVSIGAPSPVMTSAGSTRLGVGDVRPDRAPLRHGVAGGVDRAVLEQPSLPGASSPAAISGTASTYGPGYDGYLALPAGPDIHVVICGAGGCIDRVSNDTGPVTSLHRVADLSVADFELVSGQSWRVGLCRVKVEVLK